MNFTKNIFVSARRAAMAFIIVAWSVSLASAQTRIDIPAPINSHAFGGKVVTLPNGNFVVVDLLSDGDNPPIGWAGAVHLYNGATGAMISRITGVAPSDKIGSGGILILANGNFVIKSPNWNFGRGAVTFCSQTTGCSGKVTAANSLVGSSPNDLVGEAAVVGLPNGSYFVISHKWNAKRGAVTWGSGTSGVSGQISAANSLVGTLANDQVGAGSNALVDYKVLTNGNFVFVSTAWNDNRGAATFCSQTVGCSGPLSASNSVVGSTPLDSVGNSGVTVLTNGNYIVHSPGWNSQRGALTWGNGTTGTAGVISAANSMVGSSPAEWVFYATPLTNGNYVIRGRKGATWANGTTGIVGVQTVENTLTGGPNDGAIGSGGIIALTNGNYVVFSKDWNNGRGAVTFGDGNTGVTGTVGVANSFINMGYFGTVTPLVNGNYVIANPTWNENRGAVTLASGVTGLAGEFSSENSLVGQKIQDNVGSAGVAALTNGNYVVSSPGWDNGTLADVGAVTLGSGTNGLTGLINASNSLIGERLSDAVGEGKVTPLTNGNFVARSPAWNGRRGAVTFGNGTGGTTGIVTAANSLVGSSSNDGVGVGSVRPLPNGNYVVQNPAWNNWRGAATWGSGSTGVSGVISAENSLVGSNSNDSVGGLSLVDIKMFSDGSYLVASPSWNAVRGAVTFGGASSGVRGVVSAANSLVGTRAEDRVGGGIFLQTIVDGLHPFANGAYVVYSPLWDSGQMTDAGAVSIGSRFAPLTGEISSERSILGVASGEGQNLSFAYDPVHQQTIVGQPFSNRVTVFRESLPAQTVFDFDGDGKTDLSIFRPASGEWWINKSSGGNYAAQFGNSADKLTPGDFTGDGKTDIALFRPASGEWYILRSEDGSYYSFPFGASGDIPVVGDFDADGRADAGVFRPSDATWYIRRSSDGGTIIEQFGQNGDVPVAADFDGDNKTDIAIYRVSAGQWWINRSTAGLIAFQFGNSSDKPVRGDFTGDGKADVALFRPNTGEWFVLRSEDQSYYSFPFGASGDVPAPGDYDGDGRFDATVFRPSNNTWYANRSSSDTLIQSFGQNGDVPVPGAFVP